MNVDVKKIITGPIETNTYVLSNKNGSAMIVDPCVGLDELFDYIDKKGFDVKAICLTHGHFDHIMGLDDIISRYGEVDVWLHPGDREFLTRPDMNGSLLIGREYRYTGEIKDLVEGKMSVGGFDFDLYHIPGHTPGGCALVFDGKCFSGDSLFAGSIGRTDLALGSIEDLLFNVKTKLLSLSDDTVVFPGHGGRTTISREKRLNQFLQ